MGGGQELHDMAGQPLKCCVTGVQRIWTCNVNRDSIYSFPYRFLHVALHVTGASIVELVDSS